MRKLIILLLLLFVALPQPVQSRGFVFGGQVERLSLSQWSNLRRAGMSWVKSQAFANNTAATLNFVASAHEAGFKVLISAEGDRHDPIGDIANYLTFLRALALANADAIEVWNEPNSRLEFGASAADYANLYRQAYSAIGQTNPDTLVIIGAAMPTQSNDASVTAEWIWANGVRSLPGCIGVHWEDYPLTTVEARWNEVLGLYGTGRLFCFTETGIMSPKGYPFLPANFTWAAHTTAAGQAAALKAAILFLSNKTRMIIIFNIGFREYGADPQAGYSLIRPDGTCPFCQPSQ